MVCCIATYIYTHYFIVVAFLYHLGPTNGLKKRGMFQASVQSYISHNFQSKSLLFYMKTIESTQKLLLGWWEQRISMHTCTQSTTEQKPTSTHQCCFFSKLMCRSHLQCIRDLLTSTTSQSELYGSDGVK